MKYPEVIQTKTKCTRSAATQHAKESTEAKKPSNPLFAPSVKAHGHKPANPNRWKRKTFEHKFLSHPKIWRPKHAFDPEFGGHPAIVLTPPS